MKSILVSWQFWAFLSAAFAALTAIFAKVGVENINSDFATFIRTLVVITTLGIIVLATGQWQSLGSISTKTYSFLILSGLVTGASWICYFRALTAVFTQMNHTVCRGERPFAPTTVVYLPENCCKLGDAARVAPIDKLSVVMVAIFAVIFLGERLSVYNWAGILLIGCGAMLVAFKG